MKEIYDALHLSRVIGLSRVFQFCKRSRTLTLDLKQFERLEYKGFPGRGAEEAESVSEAVNITYL